ncbi:MAG: CrcB family protein [Aquimonas sp.]|jgi:fluoride exporter|nr:CrcB family protein [Xanthomonadales bacterium]MCC6505716.1 CrcB family protein [Aquimonas sp.]
MMGFWTQLALVMAGGALGSGLRFVLGGWLLRQLGTGFPWGTLGVNLLGAFCAGLLVVWLLPRPEETLWLRALLMVGVLGGFTTFSAMMIDVLLLWHETGRPWLLSGYLLASLFGGLLAVWAGWRAGHQWLLS